MTNWKNERERIIALAQKGSRNLTEYKKTLKCERCGEGRWYCLDFHHRDPTTKEFTVGESVRRSWKVIKAEIAKCEVLCANCHRAEHHWLGGGEG